MARLAVTARDVNDLGIPQDTRTDRKGDVA